MKGSGDLGPDAGICSKAMYALERLAISSLTVEMKAEYTPSQRGLRIRGAIYAFAIIAPLTLTLGLMGNELYNRYIAAENVAHASLSSNAEEARPMDIGRLVEGRVD